MATFQPFVDFTSSLGTLIVIFFGGYLALKGTLPISDLVAFFLYLEMFYTPVRNLSGAWEAVQSSLAGADRVAGLLAEREEPHNAPGAVTFPAVHKVKFISDDVSFDTPRITWCWRTSAWRSRRNRSCIGGANRGRQIHPGQPDTPVLRCQRGRNSPRWTRHNWQYTLDSLRQQISIVLQDVFLFLRHRTREHPLRPTRRNRRGDDCGGKDSQCPRLHQRAAGRLRHHDR